VSVATQYVASLFSFFLLILLTLLTLALIVRVYAPQTYELRLANNDCVCFDDAAAAPVLLGMMLKYKDPSYVVQL
jgi:hypothetical protein